MVQSIKNLKWREALPRIAADFAIVHLSMVGALAISVVCQTALGNTGEARELTSSFSRYYFAFFWLLSPVFPLVFFLNGFYSQTRRYVGRRKTWVILTGVLQAVTIFLAGNFLLFGHSTVNRSVAVPFALLAGSGLVSARLLKALVGRRFDVQPKNRQSISRDRGRILVIGGAGFIGSILVKRLLERGYRTRVLDSLLYGEEPLSPVKDHPKFELMVGDCRNIQDVVKAVRGVESIIDLAAIVGDPACEQNRELALETNYAATRMMIEIAKGHGARRFLFASSCSVYGVSDSEVDETGAVRPISLYAQTKVDSERALLDARSDSFQPTILRFATVFGLGYRPRFDLVVNLLTAKAKQEGIITIYNGQQWRPFVHVRDVAEAIVRVLESPAQLVSGEIYNVGDKRLNHTLSQVADTIRTLIPNVQVERVENTDRRDYRVNFEKLSGTLGFQARYTLFDGIEELSNAFDQRLVTDYTDLMYHNQRFLKVFGSPQHKDRLDALVMAAFSDQRTPVAA